MAKPPKLFSHIGWTDMGWGYRCVVGDTTQDLVRRSSRYWLPQFDVRGGIPRSEPPKAFRGQKAAVDWLQQEILLHFRLMESDICREQLKLKFSKDNNIIMDNSYSIFVFGRGFVVISKDEEVQEKGDSYVLKKGATIRAWGTNGKGLGLLTARGPQSSTVLDALPYAIEIPQSALHMRMHVDKSVFQVWEEAIKKAEMELLA